MDEILKCDPIKAIEQYMRFPVVNVYYALQGGSNPGGGIVPFNSHTGMSPPRDRVFGTPI